MTQKKPRRVAKGRVFLSRKPGPGKLQLLPQVRVLFRLLPQVRVLFRLLPQVRVRFLPQVRVLFRLLPQVWVRFLPQVRVLFRLVPQVWVLVRFEEVPKILFHRCIRLKGDWHKNPKTRLEEECLNQCQETLKVVVENQSVLTLARFTKILIKVALKLAMILEKLNLKLTRAV